MNNPVNWFEIATKDLERAKEFYINVFNFKFQYIEMPNEKMYMIEGNPTNSGSLGALVNSEQNIPSENGTIIYISCDDVANQANKIDKAGGKLLFPKMSIGEFGFIAQFIDSEGNRIGLYSQK